MKGVWRRGEGGQGDARQGEGSGYFLKCPIINTLIWDGEGRWTGTGTATGTATRTGTGTGILHIERRERGTGTGIDERDWDRDIAKNVALLIWGGNGIELNSN